MRSTVRVTYQFPVQGEPVYVGLAVGASQLGLAQDASAQGGGLQRIALWVYAENCDAAVERLRQHGADLSAA